MTSKKWIYVDILIFPDGSGKLLPSDLIALGVITDNISEAINKVETGGVILTQTLYQYVYQFGGVDTSIIKLGASNIETERPFMTHNNIYCGVDEKPVEYNVDIQFYSKDK